MIDKNDVEALANALRGALEGTGTGFTLLLFDFGPRGTMAYASNAERRDMIAALEELVVQLHREERGRGGVQ